jgi:hypothetical protein
MQVKFSPSVNIIRDVDHDFNYIATPNANNTVKQIINDFNVGIHSSIIIGSYGSGKSSLLWAFEQTLKGVKKYFDIKDLNIKSTNVKFLRFVGEYNSIINAFADHFNLKKISAGNQQIFDCIYQLYEPLRKNGLLVLYIDELGKFLEFAARNNAEKELYFIQQLAEFCNDPKRNVLFVSTLHQNFDAYAFGLNERQRNEWSKVKGRLKEITFNEPIEQLLALAAAINNGSPDAKTKKQLNEINNLVDEHYLFRVSKEFVEAFSFKLYPIDFISGYCLTSALQRYGQNERSLFTFLKSREYKALLDNDKEYASTFWLHDYLWANFYSFLHSKNNSDYNNWAEIKIAIERAESIFTDNIEDVIVIIKTIGILNIFANKGARINTEFLVNYLDCVSKINFVEKLLDQLQRHKIIKYSKYNESYKLFQGTDVDIDQALLNAEKEVVEIVDVASYLNKHIGVLPIITAKEISYRTGTPRNFAFVVSETPKILNAQGEIDGYINLIINESIDLNKSEHLKKDQNANIYGHFKNSKKIQTILLNIEKALIVKSENPEDRVVLKEMDNQISSNKVLLRHYFIDAIYTDDVTWYFKGKERKIGTMREFNKLLSKVTETIYPLAPTYKNEHVNRNKISATIHNARKEFFARLVNNWMEKDLGFGDNFPADKTIYISLLRESGIHKKVRNIYEVSRPMETSSFVSVWDACEEFLSSTRTEKKCVSELYKILLNKPFKLKLGLAEFIIPIFLFAKQDDYALFGETGYIPEINETILTLLARNADEYSIKAFDFEGVKINLFNWYREFLDLEAKTQPTKKNFIESIKPFLVFYRQLTQYSKNTKNLSDSALLIRDAIANSTDPEKTFFEDFPKALQTSVKEIEKSKSGLKEYAAKLKKCITEIRTSYDELVNRLEEFICTEITGEKMVFLKYQTNLQDRYKGIKEYMLLVHQRSFYHRIYSPLNDRKAWLSSITQSLIGKPLESISDIEINILFDKIKSTIHELDNLIEIVNINADSSKEKIFKFEVSGENLFHKTIVKIPKSKFKELKDAEQSIKRILGNDKQINIAVLTKLIQQELSDEEN